MSSPLTNSFDSLSFEAVRRMDAACLRFEAVWKEGRRPQLKDFVADSTGAEQTALLRELILIDVSYRRRLGETPRPDDYLTRFPDISPEWTDELFADPSDGLATVVQQRTGCGITPAILPITETPNVRALEGTFRNYDNLELIGRGGMGVVYRARDVRLNRRVALKMIRAGDHARAGERERFRTEAEVVARIRHPNIVQIYEVGEDEGRPFIALEYVEGGNLKEKLNGTPLPPREAAQLLETLARAVQSAHAHHVIHRDLKPANVLLTADGTPKITDFGLAKKMDQEGQTQSGIVMGTPAYMAPEQADGSRGVVGPASDVYALGAVLYECLTGRPPFLAATMHDTLRQVLTEDPVPPRRLEIKCPRDLETICLVCLRKEPDRRYAGALALAEDLARFSRGEPITARPVGRVERLTSWCRRHPARALAASLLVGVLVLCVLGGAAFWRWQDAESQRRQVEHARDLLAEEQGRTDAAWRTAESARKEEERQRRRAEAAQSALDRSLYFSDTQVAQRAWETGEIGVMQELLYDLGKGAGGQADLPGFEWRYLRKQCRQLRTLKGHLLSVFGVRWSPDGRSAASCGFDLSVRIWDVDTGKELGLLRHPAMVRHVSWAPDGRRLASACSDAKVHVWDTDTGKEILTLEGVPGPARPGIWGSRDVLGVDWSPDGKRLVGTSRDTQIHIWDVDTGKETLTLRGHTDAVNGVSWNRDGKRLVTCSDDGTVRIWDLDTGTEKKQLKGHTSRAADVQWDPEGQRVAGACGDGTVRIWDADTGKETRAAVKGHKAAVTSVSWSRDGKRLASTSEDKTVRVWDVETGKELRTLSGHADITYDVSWSPEGKRLISGSLDQTARIWDVENYPDDLVLKGHANSVASVAWNPDNRGIASGSSDQSVLIWDPDSGKVVRQWKGAGAPLNAVFWSPSGDLMAGACVDRIVRIWNVTSGKEILSLKGHTDKVTCLSWAPDGKRLATGSEDKTARVWDATSGNELKKFSGHATSKGSLRGGFLIGHVIAVNWSPDSRRLATGSNDDTVRICDADTGEELLVLEGHTHDVTSVDWSPDGRRLASASWDDTVRVWDSATGNELLKIKGHSATVNDVRWSPDGKRLASTSADRTVRIWDAETGKEALTLKGHTDNVLTVCWSPDGKSLASASADKTVRIWNSAP